MIERIRHPSLALLGRGVPNYQHGNGLRFLFWYFRYGFFLSGFNWVGVRTGDIHCLLQGKCPGLHGTYLFDLPHCGIKASSALLSCEIHLKFAYCLFTLLLFC
jgi:hypothetical protein